MRFRTSIAGKQPVLHLVYEDHSPLGTVGLFYVESTKPGIRLLGWPSPEVDT